MLIKWELITWLKAGAKSLIANNTIHLHFYTYYRLCLYFCFTLSHAHCQISMMISESGVDLFHSLPKIVPDIKPTNKMLWRQPTCKGRLKYLGWYCMSRQYFALKFSSYISCILSFGFYDFHFIHFYYLVKIAALPKKIHEVIEIVIFFICPGGQ